MDPKLLAAYVFAILFDLLMPIAVATFAHRRLGVSWRYFWYGALIFFLFQMITRIPAVQLIQWALAEPLRDSELLRWSWLVVLAFTAGLFEEVGRCLGYRHLVFRGRRGDAETRGHGEPARRGEGETDPRTQDSGLRTGNSALSTQRSALSDWKKGVMYGLGHGGLESMLLVGGLTILGLVNALVILRIDQASVPLEQLAAFLQARAALESSPWWTPLLGAFERLCTVAVQVAFSVLVLQAFVRGSLRWLLVAIAGHSAVDLVAVGASRWLTPLGVEGLIAVFALAGLYITFRLKPPVPMRADTSGSQR